MRSIVAWVTNHPRGAISIVAAVLILSISAAGSMVTSFLPRIALPVAVVSSLLPGAGAEEVETLITVPLEDAFASLANLARIEAMSRPGRSSIRITFSWGTDPVSAGIAVREAIDRVFPQLPSQMDRPLVYFIDTNDQPLAIVAVEPIGGDLLTLRETAEREFRSRLQQVDGVGFLGLVGGRPRRVVIRPDLERSYALGLDLQSLAQVMTSATLDAPAGSVTLGDRDFVVRTVATPENLAEVSAQPIGSQFGAATLGDIATVAWEGALQQSLFVNGDREAIGLVIWPRTDTNPLETIERVRTEIAGLQRAYGATTEITIVDDRTIDIAAAVRSLLQAGLIGATVTIVLVIALMRRVVPAVVLFAALPTSLILALGLLAISGAGINVVSLAGLSIGVGMLIDNAVVMVDNIQRRVRSPLPWQERVRDACSQMARSTLVSTLTTAIVFLPLLLLPGVLGAVFRELALAVVYAITSSFLVSILLVPALAVTTAPRLWSTTNRDVWFRRGFQVAAFAQRRRLFATALATGLTAAGLGIAALIPTTLFPEERSSVLLLELSLPAGTTEDALLRNVQGLVRQLDSEVPDLRAYARAGGEPDDPFFGSDPEQRREDVMVVVHLPTDLPRRAQAAYRSAVTSVATAFGYEVTQRSVGIGDVLDLQQLQRLAISHPSRDRLQEFIDTSSPERGRLLTPTDTQPQLTLIPDRTALAGAQANPASIAQSVQAAVRGVPAGQIEIGGRRYPIVALHPDAPGLAATDIAQLRIATGGGGLRPVSDLGRVEERPAPAALYRLSRSPTVFTTQAITIPDDLVLADPGAEERRGYIRDTFIVLAVSFALLFFVLAAQFDSFGVPWIVLWTAPVAASGGLLANAMVQRPLSVNTGLGIVVLLGLVVNNAIVLYDTFASRRTLGDPAYAAMGSLGRRLRPVVITSASTAIALIPQLGFLGGTQTQQDLAITVLGGIVVSTAATVILLPALLPLFGRRRHAS